jgi:hypothetical protein
MPKAEEGWWSHLAFRILRIEDDVAIAEFVAQGLREEGIRGKAASSVWPSRRPARIVCAAKGRKMSRRRNPGRRGKMAAPRMRDRFGLHEENQPDLRCRRCKLPIKKKRQGRGKRAHSGMSPQGSPGLFGDGNGSLPVRC